MTDLFLNLRRKLRLRRRYQTVRWALGRSVEKLRYAGRKPDMSVQFHIVSSSRNAGAAAVHCLQSVYDQNYPRDQVRHVYIDDASTDDTDQRVREWLNQHPDHNVDYIHQTERMGGAYNNLLGFDKAPPQTIVAELNGDDWFPDPAVLHFLATVYADPGVWKTHNTPRLPFGIMVAMQGSPAAVRRARSFRAAKWTTSALHTFRQELLGHVDRQTMIDPDTGEYWESADDQALYLAMLELAGAHARHLYRVTYFYNFGEASEHSKDRAGQIARNERIRAMPKHAPLDQL